MPFTAEQTAMLSARLDPKHVASRQQSGRSLSYIEGWHAIAEANRIFGFDAWHRETIEIRCVSERERKIGQQQKNGWSVSYVARVRVVVDGVTREGVGAGHGIDVDLGLAHESAIKEAETDAMKRAMMTFGNPFGLALYDKTQANVGVDAPPVNNGDRIIADTLIEASSQAKTLADFRDWKTSQNPEIDRLGDFEKSRVKKHLKDVYERLLADAPVSTLEAG